MSDRHTITDVETLRVRSTRLRERRLWRSLEEAAGSPEFEEYLHREFPSQLAVWEDPVGRREFLKLMAASLALAGVSGCTRSPDEKIVPGVRSPEDLISGKPLFYATAMPRGGYGYGVLVESHQGRPTKIEGNPEHPVTRGGTDAFMQASILGLYDPDRSRTVLNRGNIDTWDAFVRSFTRDLQDLRKVHGRGLRILAEPTTSPTLVSQLAEVLQQYPEARWHSFDPVGQHHVKDGSELAFGRAVDAVYHLDRSRVVLALDSDFLTDLPGSLKYARDFIDGRRVASSTQSMNRLYVAESTPTLTGAAADHRLPLRPAQIELLARKVLQEVRHASLTVSAGDPTSISEPWVKAVIQDLAEHRGASIIIAGSGQPPVVHAIAHAINDALGNVGKTVTYIAPVIAAPRPPGSSIDELLDDMSRGRIDTLMLLGGNPVYNMPGSLRFAERLAQVRLRIHLSEFHDETSFHCHWHIPAPNYLESWSDIRASDGTASIIQPLIAPLYEGKTAHEMLSVLMDTPDRSPFEIVQAYWQKTLATGSFGELWTRALHDGFMANTQSPEVSVTLKWEASHARPVTVNSQSLEIEFRPDSTIGDGQFANNAWLQELPKPLTKITWDNVAAISPSTAGRLNLSNGDVVELTVRERTLQAPVWVLPGQSEDCVSLTLGYGRTRAGQVGTNVGYNAYGILPPDGTRFDYGSLRKMGARHAIATTQHHHSMEGRDIVRVATFDQTLHPMSGTKELLETASAELSIYPGFKYEGNSWGMVIDQTACIGCNACVVACQAENNIPVVGKQQILVSREMHWLRVDRYYEGELDAPDIYFQPMMCVHCEQAPCEVVCPVAATVHDSEGTNSMIYNRCVGTRYCSNNCPYKVRRFNYLQFSDDTTSSLKMQRNPEVTVRSRGVMEKCSYCIQRVSAARIDAKLEDLPLVPEGSVVTACQQACPTRAITFGNLNDPNSAVRKLKSSSLNYGVLAELNTQPRTTYLTRVRNPHPSLSNTAAES